MYFIILIAFTAIGALVGARLKSKFEYYSKIGIRNGMSGAEVAHAMLRHYNINDVKIVQGQGYLTDHYNPLTKTVSLSPQVYNGRSIASAAVAAHECGHVVQHANAYSMLTLRSNLVPVMQFSSRIQQFLFMAVIFGLGAGFGGNALMLILVATFGITALFSLITLPVEFDASKRALAWLDVSHITQGEEYDGAKDALWWAAMTYVVQALGALVMFLYFLLSFLNRN
ncbi:MAG TPA: zinc metallopeptidase [Saprospiraceae bacterium]|nr:zinc metallopeptidase [Saprospiraceae bacterium]HRX29890.1 zinc metallopeptidase [Saprospiraceae bacterium]